MLALFVQVADECTLCDMCFINKCVNACKLTLCARGNSNMHADAHTPPLIPSTSISLTSYCAIGQPVKGAHAFPTLLFMGVAAMSFHKCLRLCCCSVRGSNLAAAQRCSGVTGSAACASSSLGDTCVNFAVCQCARRQVALTNVS